MDASYPLPLWLSLLLILPLLLVLRKKAQNNCQPPSPPKLPLIGNLHQIGALLHQSFRELSKKYGPVMLIHFGSIPTLVLSSADTAKEALKDHDLVFCSRPALTGSGRLSYNYLDVAFAPYGEPWRKMRQLITLELFSLKKVQSFRPVREEEVEMMLKPIFQAATTSTPVNISDLVLDLTANITFKMSFGFDYRGTEFDRDRFHEVVRIAETIAGNFTPSEFFPFLGKIADRITGHHARREKVFHELDRFFQYVIDDHLKPGRQRKHEDMIDIMLKIEKEQPDLGGTERFSHNNIKGVLLNLFLGGVDTSAITLNWAMTELVRNPRVMKKLHEEIRNCVGNKPRVTESDLGQIEYMRMVIKEVFRLHPPVVLLLPRETTSHCKISGYDIEPKTPVLVNVWAIGRDPKYWKDPETFNPERFSECSVDFKGKDFELLPFGAGRRMCVGMQMGVITVEIALANLLLCFDWKLPDGMKEEDIDIEEQPGTTIAKKIPLKLIPVKHVSEEPL